MSSTPTSAIAVWSPWQVEADSLVVVLRGAGEQVVAVDDPMNALGLLVAGAAALDVVDVIRRRAASGLETIVWGGTASEAMVAEWRDSGARAYVSALALPADVVDVVHRVREGEVVWPPEYKVVDALTPREVEVARAYLIAGGARTRVQVAEALGISERTLKAHIANIRVKAGHQETATRDGLLHALTARGWLS